MYQDIVVAFLWGAGLVYRTALGVGDKVESTMAALNIKIAETGVPAGGVGIGFAFTPLLFFRPPVPGDSGSFRGGGRGLGGGGGFGSGDARGRGGHSYIRRYR